jgi:membrane protein implicated in regulation of membrane protease activity
MITFLIAFAYILCSIFAVFGIITIVISCITLFADTTLFEVSLKLLLFSIIVTALCFAGKESLKELKEGRQGHGNACECSVHNCGEKQCLK